ncbi:hypothetical protein V1514DRAFT_330788 [Lipomyces japonicus]|uniref:uncharacterized protein n=1 Tax=Lipomyces japonicus TaxID=56871 RepID=UPI0034CE8890
MASFTFKCRMTLAIKGKLTSPKLSIRHLSKQFNVSRITLQHRMVGRQNQAGKSNGNLIVTTAEEEVIV